MSITPVEFMNAKAAGAPPVGSHLTMQPKLDGWRMAFYIDADGVRSFTRTLKPQAGKTPMLDAEFAAIFPAGTVIDGEIVAVTEDAQGRMVNDFKWVAEVMGSGIEKAEQRQRINNRPMQFVAFDVLFFAGEDVRHLTYRERLEILGRAFAEALPQPNRLISMILCMESSQVNHDALVSVGMEGSIVKDLTSPYLSGERGKGWTKIKHTPTADVIVMGFEEGKGKYSDTIGAVIFGQEQDGVLVERGRCSGMSDALRRQMGSQREVYVGQVMEITYMGKTSGNAFRHPQFSAMRPDKPAGECGWD